MTDGRATCAACGECSGDDWSQCPAQGCPMPGSPHYNPSARKRGARLQSLLDAGAAAERERIADWLHAEGCRWRDSATEQQVTCCRTSEVLTIFSLERRVRSGGRDPLAEALAGVIQPEPPSS